MAPIGRLSVGIVLERSQVQGAEEPLKGTISLKFLTNTSSSSKSQEVLFGPLQINLVLLGRMKLQVAENRTSHAYIWHYDNRDLIHKTFHLLDGPFRAVADEPQHFPFSVNFPSATDYPCTPLPPSFSTRFEAKAVRQAGKHQGVASIEYSLGVDVRMNGIDVEVVEIPPRTIRYEQHSRSIHATTQSLTHVLKVQTYALLPESERPSLVDKTKAVLRNVAKPLYEFEVTCPEIPTAITLGQPITFDVRIKTNNETTTAKQIPEVYLTDGKIDLIARTEMYATNQKGFNSPDLDSSISIAVLACKIKDPGPFSKQQDYAKTLTFEAVPTDVPTSFTTQKLSRSYRMRLEFRFAVAEQTVTMKKDVLVKVLPPLAASLRADTPVEAGPSHSNAQDYLPVYEEVVRLA